MTVLDEQPAHKRLNRTGAFQSQVFDIVDKNVPVYKYTINEPFPNISSIQVGHWNERFTTMHHSFQKDF